MTTTAYIALGSNLGDRPGYLAAALEAISALPGVLAVQPSPVYETEPVGVSGDAELAGGSGVSGGGKFLNSVAAVKTTYAALELLACLHTIEADHGRDRAAEPQRNMPRSLDLDIVLFGDEVIDRPGTEAPGAGLTVPHPRMYERWFVLKPLCDLAPDMMHPVLHRTISQLLASLETPAT